MKKIKRLLAVVLSVVMAISCFAVVPVMAEDLSTLPTYDGVKGVTLVNQVTNSNYTSAVGQNFADRASRLEVNVPAKYASSATDNTLQISGMLSASFLTEKMNGRANLMTGTNTKYQFYGNRATGTWDAPAAATWDLVFDSNLQENNGWSNSNMTAGYDSVYPTTSADHKTGSDRVAQGVYDQRFMTDLGGIHEIDTFYLFSHVRPDIAVATYKVFVSTSRTDLYSAKNEVFYYNAYNAYYAGNSLGINSVYSTDHGTVDKRCEGQFLTFGGETKPQGRYIGIIVYDTARASNYGNFWSYYEIGALGTKVDENITHVDKTEYTGTKTWAEKIAATNISLDGKYAADLQLSGITGSGALAAKVAGETNHIKSAKIQPYASKDTGNWTAFTPTELAAIKDFAYVGSGTSTGFGGTDNNYLKTTGYNSNTYSTYGDTSLRLTWSRIEAGRYDALITLDLGDKVAIDKFYQATAPNPALGTCQYAVFVGDDEATLYNEENQVFYYENTQAGTGETYKFSGSSGAGNRTAEIQYLDFTSTEVPVGKYVGLKIYAASNHGSYPGALNIYELGVYGDVAARHFDSSYATVDTKATSTSSKQVASVGTVDATATVCDAEGNDSGYVETGDMLTFKATCADSRYIFDGWYNGDTKVSSDAEYTYAWNGETLVAKYKTNLIMRMTPASDVVMKNYFIDFVAIEYGQWKYDSNEGTMYYTGCTKDDGNGGTLTMKNNAMTTALTQANNTIDFLKQTEYEPWTTYKYSVTIKTTAPEDCEQQRVQIGAAAHTMLSHSTEHQIYHDLTTEGYVTYEFYFNSGAAIYERDPINGSDQAARENKFAGNGFNISALAEGVVIHLKELAVEKVSNVQLGDTDGAVVTLADANTFKRSDAQGTGSSDANQYGGATKMCDIATYIYDGLEANKVIGATTDSVTFNVEPEENHRILSVKVNGTTVEASQDGSYTYSGAAVDDTLDGLDEYVADGMTAYIIDVETEEYAVHTVKFEDKLGNVIHTATVEENTTLAGTDALSTAEGKLPAIYGYHFTEWDRGVNEPILGDVTYKAQYEKNADLYTVTVDYIKDNEETYSAELPFDTKITGTDHTADYWTINDQVFAIGTKFTAYVAGNMDFVAARGEVTEPSVTVINDVAVTNANDNSYVTFAHVNTAGKTIKEIGFIYISGPTYETVGAENFKMDYLDANKDFKYVNGKVDIIGTDFMVTYNGIKNDKKYVRYARAYVIFEGDETVYYSNVVSKVFNQGK